MRLGNKSINTFISINLFDTDKSIFHFFDSLYINQLLQISRNTGIVYFQSFPLSYIPASGRCYHWSTTRRQRTRSVFLQVESWWRTLRGIGPAQEMWERHCPSAQLPWELQGTCFNRCIRNKEVNVVLAYTGTALAVLSLSCPSRKLRFIPYR